MRSEPISSATSFNFNPKAITMTPTRDLANQISFNFESVTKNRKIRTLSIHGQPQNSYNGLIDILVGTPGRILDYINNDGIKL